MATLVLGAVANAMPMSPWGIAARIGAVVIGGMIDRSMFQDRPVTADVKPSGSSYGAPIPRVYGCARPANVNFIWGTPTFTKHEGSSGGKGGSAPTADTFSWSFLCLLCEMLRNGETIRRIWGNDVLLYDADADTPTTHTIRIHYGEVDQDPDPFIEAHVAANPDLYDVAATPAYRGVVTVMFEELDLSAWGNYPPQITYETYSADGVELADILGDLVGLVGVDSGDTDFDAATSTVRGFVVANREPIRNTIDPLLMVFATDLVEYDGKLYAVPRGSTNPVAIDGDDLGARSNGTDQAESLYSILREQDLALPKRLDCSYSSFNSVASTEGTERPLYETGTQTAIRTSKDLVSEAQTIQTNITMSDDDARKVAERILYTLWLERLTVEIALPPKYLKIVPATIMTVTLGTRTYRLRATKVDVGLFGEIRITAVPDSISVLTQTATGASNTKGTGGETAGTDPIASLFAAFSGVFLRDEDTLKPCFYVVATGPRGWGGGTVWWSSDGGSTWTQAGSINERSMIGESIDTLADGVTAETWEMASGVTVDLDEKATPETAAREEVQNGANLMLLGDEVIGYSTVAAAGSDWELSDILRGLRGTPMTGHAGGDRAISLKASALVKVNVREDLIGETIKVKVVSSGEVLADVTAVDVVIAQNEPVYASAEDVASLAGDEWARILMLMGV